MKLTEEQKEWLRENHATTPDLIELTRKLFDSPDIDGRSKEGRAVRKFLIDEGFGFNTRERKKQE